MRIQKGGPKMEDTEVNVSFVDILIDLKRIGLCLLDA